MRKRRKMKVVQDKSLLFCYHIVHEILLLFENEQNGLGHRKGEEMNSCAILLRNIMENPDFSQRQLAERTGMSLGKVNRCLKDWEEQGYLKKINESKVEDRSVKQNATEKQSHAENRIKKGQSRMLTKKGKAFVEANKVDAALILAAGFGSRFVPLTYECPKGLLEVFGERMVERQIKQLHEVGIYDITIVVGYLKEKFDYLIDAYGVKLLYNPEYSVKNTLGTLYHARKAMEGKNFYILSSDNWMRENMYHSVEPLSWYAASYMEGETKEWVLHCAKDGQIKSVEVGGENAYCMYGPVFLKKEFFSAFLPYLEEYYHKPGTEDFYWEDVLRLTLKHLPPIYRNEQKDGQIYEFENLEELRAFDEKYNHSSGSEAMELISAVFHIPECEIVKLRCLKAGMTNQSFLFRIHKKSRNKDYAGKDFICRIPGVGTGKLINRKEEEEIYRIVKDLHITEELLYFNPENGYKISRYYEEARNADFSKQEERRACMKQLLKLHEGKKTVGHPFSLRERLAYYEAICLEGGGEIPYQDYEKIKPDREKMLSFTEKSNPPLCLCHIDAVQDNFIFTKEGVKMIDWEYAGMADPLLDIAMGAIYSYMDFQEAKSLLEDYLLAAEGEKVAEPLLLHGRTKEQLEKLLIAYMGLSGLLWSLWCAYKMRKGQEFGEYSLKMLRYFKEAKKTLGL